MDLSELFNFYGSDKDRNGYTPVYDAILQHRRAEPIQLLEIGIGTMIPEAFSSMHGFALDGYKPGGSLRAWRDFFPNGSIYGLDVQPDTVLSEERIRTGLANSTKAEEVEAALKEFGVEQFDIIIDDGSHFGDDQQVTLANLYPKLKVGGVYIVEDITVGSSFSANPKLVQAVVQDDPFFFAGLKNNLCVIRKSPLRSKLFQSQRLW